MGVRKSKKGKGAVTAKTWKPSEEPLTSADATCPACKSQYVDPVKLPCEHHICLTCLENVKALSNTECPLCRRRLGTWTRYNKDKESLIDREFQERIANIQVEQNEEPFVRDIIQAQPGEVRNDLMDTLKSHEKDLEEMRKKREQEEEEISLPLIAQLQEEERKKIAEEEERRRKQEEEDLRLAERLADERRSQEEDEFELGPELSAEAKIAKEAEEQRKKQEEEDFLLAQQLDMENKEIKPKDDDEVKFLAASPGRKTNSAIFELGKRRQSSQSFRSSPPTGSKSQKDVRKRANNSSNFASPMTKKAKSSSSPIATVTSKSTNVPKLITSFFNPKPTCETSTLPKHTPDRDADTKTTAMVVASPQKTKLGTPDENFEMLKSYRTPVKGLQGVSLRDAGTPSRHHPPSSSTSFPLNDTAEASPKTPENFESAGPSVNCFSSEFRQSKVEGWLSSSPLSSSSQPGGFYKQCSSPSEPVFRKTKLFSFLDDVQPEKGRGASNADDIDAGLLDLDTLSPTQEQVAEQEAVLREIQQKKIQEKQDSTMALRLRSKDSVSR